MRPALLLRLEGAALFFCGIFFYHSLGAGWILFVALCLWPDISMLGFLVNPKLGSRLYNLVHTEVLPVRSRRIVICAAPNIPARLRAHLVVPYRL